MKAKRQISRRSVKGFRGSAGSAFVVIPLDVDRQAFIENCLRNGTIDIMTNDGEYVENVKVSKPVFNHLTFPVDSTGLGSLVIWVNLPKHNKPIIVGIIQNDNEFINISEGQFLLSRTDIKGSIEVSGDLKGRSLYLLVDSEDEGEIKLSVKSKSESAKLVLESNNDIDLKTKNFNSFITEEFIAKIQKLVDDPDKITVIRYKRGVGFEYLDEFENNIVFDESGMKIVTDKAYLGNDNYSLKELFNDLIDEISNITVNVQGTPQPIINKAQVLLLKQNVVKILK